MRRIWIYQGAVFLSAFLFFQVQPMTSKALLPIFGGSYLVWGLCMIFYQAVLLFGYLYVHMMHRRFGVLIYARIHWILLFLPFAMVSLTFFTAKPSVEGSNVAFMTIMALSSAVGMPVFALSTTSLVLQKWLLASDLSERDNPYVLYSGSNLGSMLGLLTYPVLVEPFLSLDLQWQIWLAGYICLIVLHVFCMPRRTNVEVVQTAIPGAGIPFKLARQWFLLSASGTALLLAVTNVITLDLASIPFLWIVPLAVYLAAYVLTFKQNPWYPKWWSKIVYWAMLLGMFMYLMIQVRLSLPVAISVTIYMFILFAVCLAASGELVLSKPVDTKRDLTSFYLVIALGGLAGSLFVGWVIPVVSKSLVELPLALVMGIVSLSLCTERHQNGESQIKHLFVKQMVPVLICGVIIVFSSILLPAMVMRSGTVDGKEPLIMVLVGIPVMIALLWAVGKTWQFPVLMVVACVSLGFTESIISGGSLVGRLRNFYGIYKIYDVGNVRYLQHGTTQHGRQYISGAKAGLPLSYHHHSAPAGAVLVSTNFSFRHIGMIGLGTGAMAAYFGAGQVFTIFEIDPDNIPIAEKNFIYLQKARLQGATLNFVVGDGRISMRTLDSSALDLLLIDAFNSGSIPVHLLTVEALQEYFRVLGDDGLLFMHVSNRFIDLPPVVCSNARALGLNFCEKSNAGLVDPDAETSQWVALSNNPDKIDLLVKEMGWSSVRAGVSSLPRPWTDRYSNVLGSLFSGGVSQ
ncbi:MAG: hypothetical protein A2283_19515 [Lentisphaerae bacterium RIFOXYA12_FULL_48_11]|nr:MAG: hypothetical protein A2283_19515 [Lentisphaerae bacterium RIFOXYA12_FULL_48_11]